MMSKACLLTTALLVVSTSAQLASLPKCAVNPALVAIGGSKCDITAFECICADQTLLSSLSSAVQKACTNADDLQTAKAAAYSLCLPYATTSDASGAAGGSAYAAASTTASGSESSAAAAAAAATTSPAVSVSSAHYYAAGNATTIAFSTGSAHPNTSTGNVIATGAAIKAAGVPGQGNGEGVLAALAAVMGAVAFM